MRTTAHSRKTQLNLPLLDGPVPDGGCSSSQQELTVALVELLIHAAQENLETQADGGDNESLEAHA
jgi:hypothetical protein